MIELSDYPNTGHVRTYDIEAISLPIVYNKFGDHDPNGLMYVLKQDSQRVQRKARELFALPTPQPYEEVQPLVIRANVGDTVQINFENKLNRRASIHVQGLSYHVYNPPFCERHRRGYETCGLSHVFRICYNIHGEFGILQNPWR